MSASQIRMYVFCVQKNLQGAYEVERTAQKWLLGGGGKVLCGAGGRWRAEAPM